MLQQSVVKHLSQVSHPVHEGWALLTCISTIRSPVGISFAPLPCLSPWMREGCSTGIMLSRASRSYYILKLWVWASGSLREFTRVKDLELPSSPLRPLQCCLAESVAADVVRLRGDAKMLNLAFETAVSVTSNSRFRKNINSAMEDGVLEKEEE